MGSAFARPPATLVRPRTRYITLAKALVRRDGLRVAPSEAPFVAAVQHAAIMKRGPRA